MTFVIFSQLGHYFKYFCPICFLVSARIPNTVPECVPTHVAPHKETTTTIAPDRDQNLDRCVDSAQNPDRGTSHPSAVAPSTPAHPAPDRGTSRPSAVTPSIPACPASDRRMRCTSPLEPLTPSIPVPARLTSCPSAAAPQPLHTLHRTEEQVTIYCSRH